MKKTVKIIIVALAVLMLVSTLSACSVQGESVMTIADKGMSVNTYQLLLSRMKGTLYSYGYDVTNEKFWRTIISTDGTTYDDYFTASVQEQASRYIIADYLFDRNGLILTDDRIEMVDKLMNAYVKQAGSKSELNSRLAKFGANYDILRELLMLETKIDMLKDHLYGDKGEKLEESVKEGYFHENYVAFSQIFLATYSYINKLDEFGKQVYYTDEKYTAIAYDTANGVTKTNEYGKVIADEFGNPRYYTSDGKIAYDTVNGVIGYETEKDDDGKIKTDDDGKPIKKTKKMSASEIEAVAQKANAYLEACNGDIDLFIEHAEIYGEGEGDGETMYLYSGADYYGSIDASLGYLDDIAEGIKKGELEDCFLVQSEYGFHIVCKYEMENGAYDDEKHYDTFSDFYLNLIAGIFDEECKQYESAVVINVDAMEGAPTIAEVEVNTLY